MIVTRLSAGIYYRLGELGRKPDPDPWVEEVEEFLYVDVPAQRGAFVLGGLKERHENPQDVENDDIVGCLIDHRRHSVSASQRLSMSGYTLARNAHSSDAALVEALFGHGRHGDAGARR